MNTIDKLNFDIRHNTFARYDDALAMADLLSQENGQGYQVSSDQCLGFTASRMIKSGSRMANEPVSTMPIPIPEVSLYRPALRGFLTNFVSIAIGLGVLLYPLEILSYSFGQLGVTELPAWISPDKLVQGFAKCGWAMILLGLSFVYRYFANTLMFTETGVLYKKGLIAKDQVMIRYADIKSIAVKQGVLDSFLGLGSLHLDSAATNGDVDIVFDCLSSPNRIRQRINQLIDASQRTGR